MRNTVCILMALCACSFLPTAGAEETAGEGGRKRLKLTLSTPREQVGVGEVGRITCQVKVLDESQIPFPDSTLLYSESNLYVKTPDGTVYHAPRRSIINTRSLPTRPISPKWMYSRVITGRYPVRAFEQYVPFTERSTEWIKTETGEERRPNFRKPGEYKFWARLMLPEVDEAPANAWHGELTSDPLVVNCREIPVEKRKQKITQAQLDDLASFCNKLGARDRLHEGLSRTEEEGLAEHVASMLTNVDHENDQQRNESRQAYSLLEQRHWPSAARIDGRGSLGIVGPSMDKLALVAMKQCEDWNEHMGHQGHFTVDYLIAYSKLRRVYSADVRKRLISFAKKNARLPDDSMKRWGTIFEATKYRAVWRVLRELDELHDDIRLNEVIELLGEPSVVSEHGVAWRFVTGSVDNYRACVFARFVIGSDEKVRFVTEREFYPVGGFNSRDRPSPRSEPAKKLSNGFFEEWNPSEED